MNKYWKDKWVTALRSNEYTQTKNCLRRNNNTYCCLGVLSDLVAKEYPEQFKWLLNDNINYSFNSNDDKDDVVLIDEVIAITEVPDKFCSIDNELHLTRCNDDGYSFNQIADLIEEYL